MSCVLIVLHHQIAQKNNVENTVKIEFFRMGLQNPDSPVQIWVVPPHFPRRRLSMRDFYFDDSVNDINLNYGA